MPVVGGAVDALEKVGDGLVQHPGFGSMHRRPTPRFLRREAVRSARPDLPLGADPVRT